MTGRIIDYKASKHTGGKEVRKNHKHGSQLMAYICAVMDIWKIPVKNLNAGLFYLKNGEYITLDFNNKDLKDFKGRLVKAIKNINKGSFKAKSTKCAKKFCTFQGFCKSSG